MSAFVGLVVGMLVVRPATAGPQAGTGQETPSPPAKTDAASPDVDLDRIPVSLVRIRKGLDAMPSREDALDLDLSFYIDVYGRDRRIDVLEDFDVSSSAPVQYGGMTHNEFMDFVTPREFRSPTMNFSQVVLGFSKWMSEQAKARREAQQRERERRRQR